MKEPTRPLRKRRAWLRLDINAGPHQQRLFLKLPVVRDHLEAQRRLLTVLGILGLMKNGLTMNCAARAIKRCPSWASVMIARYKQGGAAALAPRHSPGRPPRAARPLDGFQPIALSAEILSQ